MKLLIKKFKILWRVFILLFFKKDPMFIVSLKDDGKIHLIKVGIDMFDESVVQSTILLAATSTMSLYEDRYMPNTILKEFMDKEVESLEWTKDTEKMTQEIMKTIQVLTPLICIQIHNDRKNMEALASAFMDLTSEAIRYIKESDANLDVDILENLEQSAQGNHKHMLDLLQGIKSNEQ